MSNKIQKLFLFVPLVLFITLGYFVWDANEMLARLNQFVYEDLIYSEIATHTTFWRFVTSFGSASFLSATTLLVALYFIYKHDRRDVYLYLGSMLGGLLLVGAIKNITASDRPHFIGAIEQTFSFPSGHTALSTIFLILSAYIYTKNKSHTHRRIVFVVCASLSLLIAFSRLYLGEHWVLDIVGGYLLAIFWSSLCIKCISSIYSKHR